MTDDQPNLLRAPLLALLLALLLLTGAAVVGGVAAWRWLAAPAAPCWMPEDAR